jgi:hypothetical protein
MGERVVRLVWRLTVKLDDVSPTVWRTILIRPDAKLSMLHRYLQAAMGWREFHSFAFAIEGREYGIPDGERTVKVYDARRYTLARLFPNRPVRFDYVYDLGANWKHHIDIEGEEEAQYRRQYPICIDGAEPCPPEDSDGPDGYEKLRTVLKSPTHPLYAELRAWAASQYYPRDFRPEWATWAMRDVQRGYF